jgi:antitoxin CptB
MPDRRLKMLSYRAWRRGIREADLILGPFADAHLHGLEPSQLDEFEVLLDQPDPDLYAWILGKTEAPAAFDGEVLALIRRFHLDLPSARGHVQGA